MQKTYITSMPNRAGALYRASEIIADENGNIVRVNYHKTVDLHTLFIDVEADKKSLENITERLKEIGYLPEPESESKVMLIELKLPDVPGKLKAVLEILGNNKINISYINSQSNGTPYQYFKMGLYIENPNMVNNLLKELSKECEVKILDYSVTTKILDSTVFYISFAGEIRRLLNLSQQDTNKFIVESNRIMQILEERNEQPFKTFDYIKSFAQFIVDHKGINFNPVIEEKVLSRKVHCFIIEPPCGSNIYILDDGENLMFIDGGFQCFMEEMKWIIKKLIPDFDSRNKTMVLTHGDIDHAGLIPMFSRVLCSHNCKVNLQLDYENKDNFREQNPLHAPYCKLSKIISGYVPSHPDKFISLGKKEDDKILSHIGSLDFGDMHFELFEGNGGHVKGETIFIDDEHKVVFTGDNFVNIKGFSPEQMAFNKLAPYLMTSVNVDSTEATKCRKELLKKTDGYLICPGHGMWEVNGR